MLICFFQSHTYQGESQKSNKSLLILGYRPRSVITVVVSVCLYVYVFCQCVYVCVCMGLGVLGNTFILIAEMV